MNEEDQNDTKSVKKLVNKLAKEPLKYGSWRVHTFANNKI